MHEPRASLWGTRINAASPANWTTIGREITVGLWEIIPMNRIVAFGFLFLCWISVNGYAQQASIKESRILLLLDGSSSMSLPWADDRPRFKAASEIILQLMDSLYQVNPNIEFGLRVYGHQHSARQNNCWDSRMEVMFSKDNLTQMGLRLDAIKPKGVSPIAYSISEAATRDMSRGNYQYSLILVTDGAESCDGNICEVVEYLLSKKINFRPYILSMVDHAPLKDQYNCLGNYLLVTDKGEVSRAIHQIVEDYRPQLQASAATPSPAPTASTAPAPPRPATPSPPPPAVVPEPPVRIVTRPSTPVPSRSAAPVTRQAPSASRPPQLASNATPIPSSMPEVAPQEPRIHIEMRKVKPRSYFLFRLQPLAARQFVQRTPPAYQLPEWKEEPASKPVASQPKPIIKAPDPEVITRRARPREVNYILEKDEAEKTTLEIYFTDGKGKFYATNPMIKLFDNATGQELQTFYRTVDAAGNPDPRDMKPGVYDLTIPGKANLLLRYVYVEANMRNKLILQVGKASLRFSYQGNPDRPVSEYTAIVNRRFEPGPTIRQECTQELYYEPGTYYIEVNTLPAFKRNLDVDMESIYHVLIPEDGKLSFQSPGYLGPVEFYMPMGDQFLRFHSMNVTREGNYDLILQPGTYEIRYKLDPQMPYAETKAIRFYIHSNKTTSIDLAP